MAIESRMARRGEGSVLEAEPTTSNGRAPKLSRTMLNLWLDVALFVVMVFVLWVSLMMQVVFPPPTAAAGWRLWGWSLNDWRDAQFYGLCLAILLVLEHLVLHWNWVCSVIASKVLRIKNRPDESSQAIYGVGAFIMILAIVMGSILAAMFSVQRPTP